MPLIARTLLVMARRKQAPKDLTGIRQRGGSYQLRVSGGYDPVTGRQLVLSVSARTEADAFVLHDQFRAQVRDNTAARTNVTLGYLLDEWLAGHPVEDTTRDSYRLLMTGSSAPPSATPRSPACPGWDRARSNSSTSNYAPAEAAARARRSSSRIPRPHDCDHAAQSTGVRRWRRPAIRQVHAVLSAAKR